MDFIIFMPPKIWNTKVAQRCLLNTLESGSESGKLLRPKTKAQERSTQLEFKLKHQLRN